MANDCESCQPELGFFVSPPKLPGVPEDRFVTPLVRINGQVQDWKPGMQLVPGIDLCKCAGMDLEGLIDALNDESNSALLGSLKAALGIDG